MSQLTFSEHLKPYSAVFSSYAHEEQSCKQIDTDTRRGYRIFLDGQIVLDGQGRTCKKAKKLADALYSKGLEKTVVTKILSHSHQGMFKETMNRQVEILEKYHSCSTERTYEWRDPNTLKTNAPTIHISTTNGIKIVNEKESILGYMDEDQIPDSDELGSSNTNGFVEIARYKTYTEINLTQDSVESHTKTNLGEESVASEGSKGDQGNVYVFHRLIQTIEGSNLNSSNSSMESSSSSFKTSSLSPPPPYSPPSTLSPISSTSSESSDSPPPPSPTSSESLDSPTSPTQMKKIEPYLNLKNPETNLNLRRILAVL